MKENKAMLRFTYAHLLSRINLLEKRIKELEEKFEQKNVSQNYIEWCDEQEKAIITSEEVFEDDF